MKTKPIAVAWMGRQPYAGMLELQRTLQEARRTGGHDWLLLLEHDPVFTLGRQHSIPKWRDQTGAAAAGIPTIQTERGGDITYHGPGQLVAYVIMDLRSAGIGAGDLVAMLEETAIRTLARWGLNAGRDPRNRGAWAGDRKIAQVGISVRGGVSMHGIALNVATDPVHFGFIEACGLPGIESTSIEAELGTPGPAVAEVAAAFGEAFSAVVGRACVAARLPGEAPCGEDHPKG